MANCADSNQSHFPAIDLDPHTPLGQHHILGGEPPDERLDAVLGAERHEWNERREADGEWERPCRVEDY